jgi:hypothetical protein
LKISWKVEIPTPGGKSPPSIITLSCTPNRELYEDLHAIHGEDAEAELKKITENELCVHLAKKYLCENDAATLAKRYHIKKYESK